MNDSKMCLVYVTALGLCAITLISGGPVKQTAAKQKGSAVLFFVAHPGQVREVLFSPLIFNQVMVNQGSAYDKNTGVFTAPVAGVYQFVYAAQLCRGPHNNLWYFMVNDAERMLCHAQVSGGDTTLNTCYYMEELKEGDRVWIKQLEGSCAWASTTSKTITFSGVLLVREGVSMLEEKHGSGFSCPLPSLSHKMMSSSASQAVALSGVLIAMLLWPLLLD
ncbi:unnamed protein product [Menidia menidia]|uniref:(Atlantic silverside) hypothetical protein n=1 Tax=Menidia menidia TaxID=238744 RepID=A0A8S4B1U6_9TELE|nr:unnamed protein product [Menidia menidia]